MKWYLIGAGAAMLLTGAVLDNVRPPARVLAEVPTEEQFSGVIVVHDEAARSITVVDGSLRRSFQLDEAAEIVIPGQLTADFADLSVGDMVAVVYVYDDGHFRASRVERLREAKYSARRPRQV